MPAERAAAWSLILACSRWPRSDQQIAQVADLAAAIVDWDAAIRLAGAHRVDALLHDALARAGVTLPPAPAGDLHRRTLGIVRQNLGYAVAASRLHRAFADAGIAHLFIKGSTLAALAYGNQTLKASVDIDLVVEETDLGRAEALLQALGYRRIAPSPTISEAAYQRYRSIIKEALWRDVAGVQLELHWRLISARPLLDQLGAGSPTQMVQILPGHSLPTLQPHDFAVYLTVHGCVHGWFRLKWLADMAALLATSGVGPMHLADHGDALGAGVAVRAAWLLAHRHLGLPLDESIRAAFHGDRRVAAEVRICERVLVSALAEQNGNYGARDIARLFIARRHLARGWRYWRGNVEQLAVDFHDERALTTPFLLLPFALLRRAPAAAGRRWRARAGSRRGARLERPPAPSAGD